MSLKSPFSNVLMKTNFLENSPMFRKARSFLGDKVLNSIANRFSKYVNQRPNVEDTGYTIFGIALGVNGIMPHADLDYAWTKAIECFGDNDEAKKFLGSMLMKAFVDDDQNWLFIQDPEKAKKQADGDIPEATQYFLDNTGKGYHGIVIVKTKQQLMVKPDLTSLDILANKFRIR